MAAGLKRRKILVTGGAGYIGSHMVKVLHQSGHDAVILDNLSSGRRQAARYGRFVEGDIGDPVVLDHLMGSEQFDGIMHFASHSLVGESVRNPAKYYRNNVAGTQILLDAMVRHGVLRLIFSSTAAVFGEPEYIPIDESHRQVPINPYGKSKLMVEHMLDDYDRAYGLKSVSLRYFNAAGADPDGELGECHEPETHLIPLVLQAVTGFRKVVKVYGTDYTTLDGTCVRDFIHVLDICDAHRLAMNALMAGGNSDKYNLGNGKGYSVNGVIETVRRVTGNEVPVLYAQRRPGDPGSLIASAKRIHRMLGWQPKYTLEMIVSHAWCWEKQLHNLRKNGDSLEKFPNSEDG